MAVNIGQLNFGIGADTTGLDKSLAAMKRFEKSVDRLSKSQVKGAKEVARALTTQESAIKKAFVQTQNLLQQLKKAGAPAREIDKVKASFNRLTKELTSGKLSLAQFNRTVDAFNTRMNRTQREVRKTAGEMRKGKKGTSGWIVEMRNLESSAVLALGPLSGLGARVRSLSAIFGRSGAALGLLVAGVAAFFIAVGAGIGATVKFGEAMKGLQLRFTAATGSAQAGSAAFQFTIRTARKLGLEVEGLARSYSRFLAASQGTNLEGKKAEKIFVQVARAAAALKLDAQDTEGVFRALEQIMSKGTVQAEELRGQLGDRIPGAFRIAAEAMGLTTKELNKLLKAGKILSEDFLPRWAAALEEMGKNAEANLGTVSGQMNNLRTNTKDMFNELNKATGISKAFAAGIAALNVRLEVMILSAKGVPIFVKEFEQFGKDFGKAEEPVSKLTSAFTRFKEEIEKTQDELQPMVNALHFFKEGKTGESLKFLLKFFERLPDLAHTSTEDLEAMAEVLGGLVNADVAATTDAVAAAWEVWAEQIQAVKDAFERGVQLPDVLKNIAKEVERLTERNAALAQGPDFAKIFDKQSQATRQYADKLEELGMSEGARKEALAALNAVIAEQIRLEKANADAKRMSTEVDRLAARTARTRARQVVRVMEQINEARAKAAAILKGPDELERFSKVDRPLARMVEDLKKVGIEGAEAKAFLNEYEKALEAILFMTDRIARANQRMADAIVTGFEQMILDGKSVTDMLHDLANELLRVAIRALFLDKLKAALFGIFQGGGAPGIDRGAGGGVGDIGTFATGGSFKLSGSGGSDKIPFFGMGKPGETVSVTRPDQKGGGAGSGVTITQNNFFEGGISDPATLIPILEENNRKLKGEILIGLDRGSFR